VSKKILAIVVASALAACSETCSSCSSCSPPPASSDSGIASCGGDSGVSCMRVENRTDAGTTVFVSWGSGNQVAPWPVCGDSGTCSFPLAGGTGQDLPTGGAYLNATFAFDKFPACATTLGEVDLGNTTWLQDTANISLVNGWSNDVEIDVAGGGERGGMLVLGPTRGPDWGPIGNRDVFGVYPPGCDICVARDKNAPCGFKECGDPDGSPPECGCKAGTQYDPKIPCQASFPKGSSVVLALVAGIEPAVN